MITQILMIEDDERLAEMVREYLAPSGLQVAHCTTAGAGIEALQHNDYDAVILDIMLPDFDGFEACKQIRRHSDVPILMLTARGDAEDRIVGLEIGADDYLPKPFNPRELLARLRAILRRRTQPGGTQQPLLRFGRLTIDRDARVARIDDEERTLTSYQFDLLTVLAENAGRVLSRDQLMDHLRGHELEAFDRSIDVHISRIRAAIEEEPKRPRRVLTVRGSGYLFARKQDD
ncbi:MAG: response regulator transcription factor [Gammaproteobacteria bacterium]|nr:response regulator transcription factor [Gammaproteobacteria bacterium]